MVNIINFEEKRVKVPSHQGIRDTVSTGIHNQLICFQEHKNSKKINPMTSGTKKTSQVLWDWSDRNLININSIGAEYIKQILTWVYESLLGWKDRCTDVDFILRIEHHVKRCNIVECRELLRLSDHYLKSPTICESHEKPFMMHVRNKIYERLEFIRWDYLSEYDKQTPLELEVPIKWRK